MKNLKYLCLLLPLGYLFILTSCQQEDAAVNKIDLLSGKWIEKESDEIIQFGGTNYIIEFKTDSFFLSRRYWTDALDPQDDCVNGHTDYYKGTYEMEEGQISFTGKATNSEFVLATPPCGRSTIYEESFPFEKESEEVLILNPEQETYFQIRLLKEE